ncbi:tetratricopeptide repeat protein [Catellatospora methionotrophica]|uniref:tetratricopeptide repeat protein n=1 Tax=Catellatospora methionotrophica TaxID=121620 RepID=UPI00140D0EF7|nr:tetratricopeptide repeat protein [Catellatospora methionotrophica]
MRDPVTPPDDVAVEARQLHDTLTALGEGRHAIAVVLSQLPRILSLIDATPVEDETTISLRVYNVAIVALLHHQMGERAVPLAERARDVVMLRLGPEHEVTLSILETLASTYQQSGQHTRAVQLLEKVLTARQTTQDPDDPDIWHVMQNLGGAYHAAGRHREALATVDQIEAHHIRTVGPWHRSTFMARNNRAVILRSAGDPAEAIRILELLVPEMEQHLGAQHADTVDVRDGLARARRAHARTSGAHAAAKADPAHPRPALADTDDLEPEGGIDEMYALVRDQTAARGAHDLHTLIARVRAATTLRNQGHLDEAREEFERTLADCVTHLGENHPVTLDARIRLAFTLWRQDEDEQALIATEVLVVDCERELGRLSRLTITAVTMLINLYSLRSRSQDADQLLDEWHADIIEVLGFEHELTRLVLAQRTLRQYGIDQL